MNNAEIKPNRKPARPFSVTLLALGVLSIAGFNLIRLIQAVEQWELLEQLLPFSPLYLVLTGLLIGLLGLILAWGLWRGLHWALRITRLAALGFVLYYWLDRQLLADSPARQTNWPFATVLTVVLLALTFWLLSRRKVKAFFGESNEQ